MAKSKKAPISTPARAVESEPAIDPHDVLRRPASPPRRNVVAFLVALGLFFAWFVYLIYVATVG